jgi:hypothetical protein
VIINVLYWNDTRLMAPSQSLDWRRVTVFTPLMAAVSVFLVYARDLTHRQVMVVGILLFAIYTTLFEVVPMREFNLPVTTRRTALFAVLAGLVAYLWLAGTTFFRQVPSLSLFLLIFVVIELTLILIVRSAANASSE